MREDRWTYTVSLDPQAFHVTSMDFPAKLILLDICIVLGFIFWEVLCCNLLDLTRDLYIMDTPLRVRKCI